MAALLDPAIVLAMDKMILTLFRGVESLVKL
jgi:hypothetical protein